MTETSPPRVWTPLQRAFHWGMAVLVLAMLTIGFSMTAMENAGDRFAWTQTHKSLGFVVLALIVVRSVVRLQSGAPAAEPGWRGMAAKAVHGLLYGLMVALPLTGWLQASASPIPIPITVFRIVPLPALVSPDMELLKLFKSLHAALALALSGLVALHVLAVIWHVFALDDDVLSRMTTGR
ncbi:cytochrome b [Alsobacter sp. R-9]